jgi:gluconate kinase
MDLKILQSGVRRFTSLIRATCSNIRSTYRDHLVGVQRRQFQEERQKIMYISSNVRGSRIDSACGTDRVPHLLKAVCLLSQWLASQLFQPTDPGGVTNVPGLD